MSLIVEASRSIFARDGPALLKAVTTWQRSSITPDVGYGRQWLYAECVLVLFVYRCDLAIRESAQLGSSGAARMLATVSHNWRRGKLASVVMASLLGTVGAFQEGQEDWTCYCERLEQFFQANGIDDEGKRRAVLLSVCGGPVYQLIRNLAAPGKPSDKSFSELEVRDGESVSQFVAELHKLSEHCDFENSLEDMLRDVRVQRRLLAEAGLTFAKAFGLAQTSELAEKNFQDLQHSEGTPVHPEHKVEPAGRPWSGNCSRCGGKHKASDCRCKSLVCYKCGKQGHWLYDTIPLNEQSGKTPMDGDKTETYALYNLSSSKSRMPLVQLLMTSGLGELRTYTVPYALRDIVEQELERLQRDGVIEPVRFSELMGRCGIPVCCNFGFLSPSSNSIDDVLASMTGAKVFSKLDLSHAYLLEEESKEFVTISTHKGLFRYNLLPFGVAAAPAIFQRTMEGIFPTFRYT
ncbi:hypothetical protein EMCRGX_G030070 [Ephydatia muelleri]